MSQEASGWSLAARFQAARLVHVQDVDEGGPPVVQEHDPAIQPSTKPPGPNEPATPKAAPTRAESLDTLFARLSKATDSDEATGIASIIQRVWMQSGSDTADLLMTRAMTAMANDNHPVAVSLLDKIVILRPGWAEAWNKRATLRFLDGDDAGSMEDIAHTLVLEPRHFGALSGLGFILQRNGLDKAALKALRRAEEIYPKSSDIHKAVEDLVPDVEGRDL